MAGSLEALKQRLLSSWTYLDVLALAMAKADGTRFVADPQKWNQVVADLKRRIQGNAPKLLEGVFFDWRDPGAPYSEQVEGFFRVMARSRSLSLGNPAYEVYEMKPQAKKDIADNQGPLLREYENIIDEMASEIDTRLKA